MDTGDLSDKTYEAILLEAERFHPDLTLQFGLLSYECDDESSFIKKAEALVCEMMRYDESDWEDIFFDDRPPQKEFRHALKKILGNILTLKKQF